MSFFAKAALVLSVLLTVTLATVTLVLAFDQTHDERTENVRVEKEACDRREAIVEAFDAYTDALIAAGSGTDRTPQEQAAYDERVAAFRADIAERLAPLEPTDCTGGN